MRRGAIYEDSPPPPPPGPQVLACTRSALGQGRVDTHSAVRARDRLRLGPVCSRPAVLCGERSRWARVQGAVKTTLVATHLPIAALFSVSSSIYARGIFLKNEPNLVWALERFIKGKAIRKPEVLPCIEPEGLIRHRGRLSNYRSQTLLLLFKNIKSNNKSIARSRKFY